MAKKFHCAGFNEDTIEVGKTSSVNNIPLVTRNRNKVRDMIYLTPQDAKKLAKLLKKQAKYALGELE